MSLEQYESSVEEARPVFLYLFTLGTRSWRYTSAATDELTLDGYVWQASAMSHTSVRQTGDSSSDTLTIEAPIGVGPAQVYLLNPPTNPISLRIFQKDAADSQAVAMYAGEVKQVNFPAPGKASIACETLSATLRREGLRFVWQRSCPYALYDPLTCKVNKASYAVSGAITNVDGFSMTVDSTLTAEVYAGGFFEFSHPVKGTEFLAIESQTGTNQVRVFGTTADLYPGMTVTLYRGCNRSPSACASFNNFNNYGGIPALPGKSPFDSSPVFY